jgi:glycosyltransferase involved in cell wall biosynthesis
MGKTLADILFIAHEGGRNGASIFLRDFLGWLKAHNGPSFEILLAADGALAADFAALAPTTVLLESAAADQAALTEASRRLQGLRARDWRLVYANTACNAPLLDLLARPGQPVLTHVLESGFSLGNVIGRPSFERVRRATTRWVAASSSIHRELLEDFGLAADKVDLVPCACRLPRPDAARVKTKRAETRLRLGLGGQDIVVLGAGLLSWRKGPDLFIGAAAEAFRQSPEAPLKFIWAGKPSEPGIEARLAYDVERAGLVNKVRFLGERPDMEDLYAAADIFALTSREEPLGLVIAEAAAMERPVVCFRGVGSAAEFIDDVAGLTIPYPQLGMMADALLTLAASPSLASRMGAAGKAKAMALHDVEAQGPAMLAAIKKTMG